MLDVCLLGTGGMAPLPKRHLASMMLRYNGNNILFNCGEATQIAIKEKGWSFKSISLICFTHFHGDHIGGLPGLLLSMGNSDKRDTLTLVGPPGLTKVVNSLRVIAPALPFAINFIELDEDDQELWFDEFRIEAFKVHHKIPCFSYNFIIDRAGRFDAEKAKSFGLPVNYWNRLQKGEEIEFEGKTYTPDMVMGPARKGLKITYCTDTRPVPVIAAKAKDADIFVCEGMYGEHEKQQDAVEKCHMTMQEAAYLAKKANPKELWYTHYSPSMWNPADYMDEIREIFPRAKASKDLKSTTLKFEDDE